MELETEPRLDNLTFWIKTEEEFIKEFGKDWEDHVIEGWNSYMNRFLGVKIYDEYKIECLEVVIGVKKSFRFGYANEFCWISMDMIKYEYREQITI